MIGSDRPWDFVAYPIFGQSAHVRLALFWVCMICMCCHSYGTLGSCGISVYQPFSASRRARLNGPNSCPSLSLMMLVKQKVSQPHKLMANTHHKDGPSELVTRWILLPYQHSNGLFFSGKPSPPPIFWHQKPGLESNMLRVKMVGWCRWFFSILEEVDQLKRNGWETLGSAWPWWKFHGFLAWNMGSPAQKSRSPKDQLWLMNLATCPSFDIEIVTLEVC